MLQFLLSAPTILLILTWCTLLLVFIKWRLSYWQRQGFPYLESKIPFGVLDAVFRRERSFGMALYDVYRNSNEKVLGIYMLFRPALLIRDVHLARDMLAKDFVNFHDRGIYVDEERDPISGTLFALRGQSWKTMRYNLTPAFTSGKLKAMFGTINDVSVKMLEHLHRVVPEKESAAVELKRLFLTYAIDIIGSVIFGVEVNSFVDTKNSFHEVSQKVNQPNFASNLRGTCQFLYPALETFFQRLGWSEKAHDMMRDMVQDTITKREQNNVVRRDMLQMLLQIRNTGKVNADDNVWNMGKDAAMQQKQMSVDVIAAQLFLFYVAGYETTSTTAAFTVYELSQYPELLAKAQMDVEQAIQKHGGMTYEALQEMEYLQICISESIRKYPGLPLLNRECTADYKIPGTDRVIKKGTPIIIPIFGIQRDEQYFPNAMGYDPERFLTENMNYDTAAYFPFGEGPRKCIAARLGVINVKVAVATILTNFNIEVQKERRQIEIDNYGIPIQPKGGINVRLSRKKTDPTH